MALISLLLLLPAQAQDYAFPSTAADYGSWYPTAYYDHGGNTDWNCADLTYGGHTGSDFGGGSWSGMHEGRDIAAAAVGVVTATNDGVDDGCSTGDCEGGGGLGNYVMLQHADGKATWYGHMKTWSVAVSVGQTVACGQKLGEMGSSGYSTGPHVHFTSVNTSGSRVDPFDGPCSDPPSYWVDQGVWDGLPALICDDVAPCTQVARLHCGESISTANDAAGATSVHGAYGCGDYTYSGPEIAYAFATELDEAATISVTGNSGDVDLFVLSSEACDGTGSVGCSVSPDAEPESVSFTASAGAVYTVVVDGWEGAVTAFTLSATCTGGWPGEGDGGSDGGAPDGGTADGGGTDTGTTQDGGAMDGGATDGGAGGDAGADSASPDLGTRPGDKVPLGPTGCGGSAAGVLIGLGVLGRGLRRRRSSW